MLFFLIQFRDFCFMILTDPNNKDLVSNSITTRPWQFQELNVQAKLTPKDSALKYPPPKSSLQLAPQIYQKKTFSDTDMLNCLKGKQESSPFLKKPMHEIYSPLTEPPPKSSLKSKPHKLEEIFLDDTNLQRIIKENMKTRHKPQPTEPNGPLSSPRLFKIEEEAIRDHKKTLDQISIQEDQVSINIDQRSMQEDRVSINVELDSTPTYSTTTYSKVAILEHLFYLSEFDKSAIFLGKKSDLEKTFLKKFNNIFSRCVYCVRNSDIAIDNLDNQQKQNDEYVFVTENQYFLVTCSDQEIKDYQRKIKEKIKKTQYLQSSAEVEIDLTNIENNNEIRQFKISNSDILNSFNKSLQNQICQASKKISFSPKTKTKPKISCTLGAFGIKKINLQSANSFQH